MTDNVTTPPATTQRIKLALIPVLALGLAAVLFWPKTETVNTTQQNPRAPLPVFPAAAGNQPTTGPAGKHVWREIDVDEVIAFNPFARPAQIDALFRTESAASQTAEVLAIESTIAAPVTTPPPKRDAVLVNVQAIFQSSGIAAALIDGQVVHAGDVLKDGSKIVAITPEGVLTDGGSRE